VPDGGGGMVVAPLELRRDDVGRVDGAIEGHIDVEAGVGAIHGDGAEVFRDDAGIGGWGRVLTGRGRARETDSSCEQQDEGGEKNASHESFRPIFASRGEYRALVLRPEPIGRFPHRFLVIGIGVYVISITSLFGSDRISRRNLCGISDYAISISGHANYCITLRRESKIFGS